METTKRRSFVQRVVCLFGGVIGASSLPSSQAAPKAALPVPIAKSGSIELHLECRHKHRSGQQNGHAICGGEILDAAGGRMVGHFHANCFNADSPFGTANPFAASNVEMHTLRLADGTLFGMGASSSKTENEKAHAIIGGTGKYAGARGTYIISGKGAPQSGSKLTINLIS